MLTNRARQRTEFENMETFITDCNNSYCVHELNLELWLCSEFKIKFFSRSSGPSH